MAVLVKNLNGLAYASVKNRNGLAVASIKNINGLDATSGGAPFIEYTATALSGSSLTAYTFAAQALGTAVADRKIVIGVYGRRTFAPTLAVSTLTVDGVSAALVPGTASPALSGAVSSTTELWIASVPSNTTGDVVVTFNNGATRCAISVYKLTGITGTPYDVAVFADGASGSAAITLDADVTASSVAVAMVGNTAVAFGAFTGLTEDADATVSSSRYGSGHYTSAGAETPRTMNVALTGAAVERVGSLAVFN